MSPRRDLAPDERADLRDLAQAALHVLVLAAAVVPGSVPWAGPVLLTLSLEHGLGVHLADLVVVALGLLVPVAALRRGLLRGPLQTAVQTAVQTALQTGQQAGQRTGQQDRARRRAARSAAVRLAPVG